MLLHYTDTKYDNIVYHIGSPEWGAAKENNAWDLSFPNLPYYVDGNVKLTQSNAILRHLGRQNGLYGLNENHAAEIDMLLDTSTDIKMGLARPNALLKTLVSNIYYFKVLTTLFRSTCFSKTCSQKTCNWEIT